MRRLALVLLPCALAVLVHLWLAQKRCSTPLEDDDKHSGTLTLDDGAVPSYEVLVGVLSARQHSKLRQAIRDTWLGYLHQHPHFKQRVGVKFIVGKHGCPIPEEDREDPYSCSLLNITEPEREIVMVSDPMALVPSDVSAVALDFKVLHPVVITRLGVFPRSAQPELKSNVTVKLLQLDQEEAIVTARFSAISTGTLVSGIWYKPVEQFILPKGFEGTLVWESSDLDVLTTVNSSCVQLNDGGGVLKFSSIAEGILPHRSALGFPGLAGGFTFTIYGLNGLCEHLWGRPARMERYASGLRQEDAALKQESLRHGDMVFVDVVDTYRNVPSKLLQFYKWSVANIDFSLLLKTDDDCYIDVDSVLMKIEHKGLKRSHFWWGNGKSSNTPVPPTRYMGIWMAAVGPQKYQDPSWLCEKECYLDMLSSPQHTAEELRAMWDRKRTCGDPCGCPWGQ
uniref:Hexosyltransferase n=1 Tax=Hippocampus comes TaxID=109280 RepID=A0A3Q2XSP8_HIPCM